MIISNFADQKISNLNNLSVAFTWERADALLYLEDGRYFRGKSIGWEGTTGGELCFNTGMTGYQEIYTDPSYYGQIIINTNVHIGNYGIHKLESQSHHPQIKGLIIKSIANTYSRHLGINSLEDYLKRHRIIGISEIDTRALVIHIRNKGAMNALITTTEDLETCAAQITQIPNMNNLELASQVTTREPYYYGQENLKYKVAILDLGLKQSILDCLVAADCYCRVFPATTSFATMAEWSPDGYMLSNGPGDPGAMDYAVRTTKAILAAGKPIFGICLGQQIIGRACGLETYKMHHGHRGLNHPVKNLKTGRSEITSQNHGFAVVEKQVEEHPNLEITHVNLNDQTIEGFRLLDRPAACVQYHPEAAPGPHDARYLFENFVRHLA